jgi:hypothetical protein
MSFWHVMFGFLYTRDWYSGRRELSRPRVALFSGMVLLIALGVVMVALLQAPVVYEMA